MCCAGESTADELSAAESPLFQTSLPLAPAPTASGSPDLGAKVWPQFCLNEQTLSSVASVHSWIFPDAWPMLLAKLYHFCIESAWSTTQTMFL